VELRLLEHVFEEPGEAFPYRVGVAGEDGGEHFARVERQAYGGDEQSLLGPEKVCDQLLVNTGLGRDSP